MSTPQRDGDTIDQAWQDRYLPSDGQAGSDTQHLQQVLQAVDTYLPQHIVRSRLVEPRSPDVAGEFVRATLLFADISGFTAMSEQLSQLGREGAEVITRIVNGYFATMLEIIAQNGGDLFKFGGDALLVCFGSQEAAARACHAALQMQQAMTGFRVVETVQGAFGLRMTAALSTGTVFLASLGSAGRVEFAVMGPTVAKMARAEDQARAGEVIVDRATRDAAGAAFSAQKRAPGYFHLQPSAPQARPPAADAARDPVLADLAWLVPRLDALSAYLPPEVLERIVASPGQRMFEGEHRLVTVLFANYYGINPIIEALGPEHIGELTGILNQHLRAMRAVIQKYGGTINKVDTYAVGYRIMVLFGAPVAHEDDPERAVRAALEMQEAMAAFDHLATSAGEYSIKQRIGINTGHVFAGNLGSTQRQEYSVMGDEVNLTSRLMGIAAEGQVLISQATADRVGDCFDMLAHKIVKVKGKEEPVRSFQVQGSRAEGENWSTPRTEFFGRIEELATVRALADRALQGQGSVLDVSGDAGVGKSRLVAELREYASSLKMAVLQGEGVSYGRYLPYLPWAPILNALLGLSDGGVVHQDNRRSRLLATLEDEGLSRWAPVVGAVMGLEIDETPLTASLNAQLRQERFFDIVLQLVQGRAKCSPLMVVLDDMQWADAISLDLVAFISRHVSRSALLLVVVRRPDLDVSAWCQDTCEPLPLSDLDDPSSLALARSSLGGGDLAPQLESLILERTQGNPLFVEEITRALSESGAIEAGTQEQDSVWAVAAGAQDLQVPTTLTGLIMSRIDHLEATNRQLLQIAAVIGTAFHAPVLARTYPYGDLGASLASRLNILVGRDLLSFSPPDAYAFKHTLTREVAYESLSFARRRELHVHVGEDIERSQAGDLTEQYGVLAQHFERGQIYDKAFVYLVKAGDRAQVEFANDAALADYRRALEIAADHAPPVPDLEAQVLDVLEAMGDTYLLTSRYGEAIEQFQRAVSHPACQRRRQGDLLRKVAKAHELQGLFDEALQFLVKGERALSEAAEEDRGAEMARISSLTGWVRMRRGEVEAAIEACQRGLTLVAALDRGAVALSIEADLYNTLGTINADLRSSFAEAAQAYERTVELRQEAGDLPELARSYNNLARTSWAQGDLTGASSYLERSMEISRQIGNNYAVAFGYNNLGVIAYTTGNIEQALENYHAALSLRQRIGDTFGAAQTSSNLGEAYLSLEQHDQARHHLEQSAKAFEKIQSEGELPEVYRLLAEIELARDDVPLALEYARRAERISASIGNAELQGIAQRVLALGQARAGTAAQARSYFASSIELLDSSGHQVELARSHYEFGLMLVTERETEQARDHLGQAAALFEAAGAEKEAAQARAAMP